VSEEPIGGPLVLRHASKRKSGTWGPDDYDVIHDGRRIGRIFKPRAGAPDDRPWMWTITGAVGMPALLSQGFWTRPIYFRLRADFLARERLAAVFAGFAIKNSSGLWPSFLSAASHFGMAPLPAQVSPFGPRYFGATFTPLSDVREECLV
jgi:hypothetical protein